MLRHYFAQERYEFGWDLAMIQKALGHKDIKTTIRYLKLSDHMLEDAQEEYFSQNEGLFNMESLY